MLFTNVVRSGLRDRGSEGGGRVTPPLYEKCRHRKPTENNNQNRNRFLKLEVFIFSRVGQYAKNIRSTKSSRVFPRFLIFNILFGAFLWTKSSGFPRVFRFQYFTSLGFSSGFPRVFPRVFLENLKNYNWCIKTFCLCYFRIVAFKVPQDYLIWHKKVYLLSYFLLVSTKNDSRD